MFLMPPRWVTRYEDVVEEANRLEPGAGVVVDVGEGQGRIDPPASQGVQRLGRFGVDQFDLQTRILLGDDIEHSRNEGGHRRRKGGQTNAPGLGMRHGDRLALGPLQQVENLPTAVGQRPPLLGETDPAPRPGEQDGASCPR